MDRNKTIHDKFIKTVTRISKTLGHKALTSPRGMQDFTQRDTYSIIRYSRTSYKNNEYEICHLRLSVATEGNC